jgi:hypothetical protein
LIGTLPELRQQRDEVGRLLAEAPKEKLDAILLGGFSWSEIYEYSFAEHISIAVIALNAMPLVSDALASADPQQHVLDNMYPTDD